MTATTIRVQMAQRKDTAANWTAANPILLSGEIGYETDTKKFKIGDGTTNWNSLAYLPIPDGSGNLTVTGNLEIGSTGSLTFEGSTADGFETTLAVTDPTADRTITLPNVSGTVVTTGDTGSVTSTMIADGTIVDADVSATAEIAVSKLANGTANQVLVTDGTDVSWSDDLTLAGNLTVNGTTTTVNTETLVVEDKNIELGVVGTPTDLTADGGGITLKGTTDKTINWVDATDSWTSSEHVDLASGKSYHINGAEVLNSTTLGSGVTGSSLTSVGTISSGTWQGAAIDAAYLDSTVVTTGDTGTVTSTMIADGTIVDGDINASAAIAGTKISPDFGSQNVTTTGTVTGASLNPTSSTVPTNGVYLPSANTVAISTNGTGRLFVDASGNIGVGSSSPTKKLEITPATSQDGISIRNTGAVFGALDFDANRTGPAESLGDIRFLWNGTPTARIIGVTGSDTVNKDDAHLTFWTADAGTPTERLRITSAGLVGVGTSSPGARLHVGTASLSGNWSGFFGDNLAGAIAPPANYGLAFGYNRSNGSGEANIAYGTGTGTGAGLLFASYDGTTYTNRVAFDGSGRVGIGTTSPGAELQVNGNIRTSGAAGTGYELNDANTKISIPAANSIAFTTSAFERARIDNAGRLLVGTSTSASGGQAQYARLQVEGNTFGVGQGIVAIRRASSSSGLTAGTPIGQIDFTDNAGEPYARIEAIADGSTGTGDYPSRLVFSTTSDASASPTERLRITSAGVLQVADAGNIAVGTTTGTKIGTATTQKLGFFNATPVVQPAAVADATDAATVITQLNDLLAKLRTLGIIAT